MMQAMVLREQMPYEERPVDEEALHEESVPKPEPQNGQVLVRVEACAVCRTDLHVIDGELPDAKLPLIPGHEIVGVVEESRAQDAQLQEGDRVGIPWLGYTCGECRYCREEKENLCPQARFTGYQIDGGYAEYTVADARYAFPIPEGYDPVQAAPLLCAGLIGYRSYRMTGKAENLGLYGFGAAAHILAQIAIHQDRQVYAFTKPGDDGGQQFARKLGAVWAGGSDEAPPEQLDAAIIFAPVGALVPTALKAVRPGGVVVCAGIHMSDIPSFPYRDLWEERVIRSVANLTRQDGEEFLEIAPQVPVETHINTFPLSQANGAVKAVREGTLEGAAVLTMNAEHN